MSEIPPSLQGVIVVSLVIAMIDWFRFYVKVFKKFGGFENFMYAHFVASAAGMLRILFYAIVIALLAAFLIAVSEPM